MNSRQYTSVSDKKQKVSISRTCNTFFLFWRSYGSWGITSNYSGLDTGRLQCLGLNRALLFTVPSARDVVTGFIWKQERIKCV